METAITLKTELLEMLVKDAEQESKSINEIVNEAVSRYLREKNREKLRREIAAFVKMHPQLRQTHMGKWVAVHEQKLVDSDSDGTALYERIRAKYGKTAVLLREVEEEPDRELWLQTPSTGKIKA